MSDPYAGTVYCYWCELDDREAGIDPIPMPAQYKAKWPKGKFACRGHADMLLLAGLHDGPLPVPDEGIQIMLDAYGE
jgi:hypothetical protein